MEKIKKFGITPLWCMLFIIPFLWGGFYDFAVCFINIALIIILLVKYLKNKLIKIELNYPFYISLIFVIGNILALFWAVDKICALFGLIRSIALFMFVINLFQIDVEKREKLNFSIFLSGLVMIIISGIFAIIPATRSFVVTDGNRFTGFFQYANSFAIFLLIGLIIFIKNNYSDKIKIPISMLFIIAILLTGSRITFLLLVLSLIYFIFKSEKKGKVKYLTGLFSLIVICLVIAIVTNNYQNLGRIFTMSFSSSTLIGRIIYYKDGLAMLLNNLFGYGYMGYSYVYPTFQTAPYYIKFIHNDYLQIALDIGILPLICFVVILVRAFLNKRIDRNNIIILIFLCIHMFFEFDLQFFSLLCIFSLLIYNNSEKTKQMSFSFLIIIFEILIIIWSGYFGIASISDIFEIGDLGFKLISNYTSAKEKKSLDYYINDNLKEANKIAEDIISQNKYSIVGYNIKSYYSCATKKYDDMIYQKQKAIKLDKYNMENYDDYILILSRAIEDSIKSSDYDNANKYINYALDVENMLNELKENTSDLAYKINDSPTFELNENSKKYLEVLKNK